ncbi:MAG: helix-turn-helix domain-containing protein [Erysipelotrichaceae bacterium]
MISEYINQQKVEEAKIMLSKGSSISETSDNLGFNDESYFGKIFKKYTGLSPKKYVTSLK